MGQTAYGVWATCVDPETILEEWYEWLMDDVMDNPDLYSGGMTDEAFNQLLSKFVKNGDMYGILAEEVQGKAGYDILQMTSASDCGEYTVFYFSTEVVQWI